MHKGFFDCKKSVDFLKYFITRIVVYLEILDMIYIFKNNRMVYSAWEKWSIYYLGNNLYAPWILDYKQIDQNLLMNRVDRLKHEEQFFHISNIDDGIFIFLQ